MNRSALHPRASWACQLENDGELQACEQGLVAEDPEPVGPRDQEKSQIDATHLGSIAFGFAEVRISHGKLSWVY